MRYSGNYKIKAVTKKVFLEGGGGAIVIFFTLPFPPKEIVCSKLLPFYTVRTFQRSTNINVDSLYVYSIYVCIVYIRRLLFFSGGGGSMAATLSGAWITYSPTIRPTPSSRAHLEDDFLPNLLHKMVIFLRRIACFEKGPKVLGCCVKEEKIRPGWFSPALLYSKRSEARILKDSFSE